MKNTLYMIKTSSCPKCRMIEPEYKLLKEKFPSIDYIELVMGIDPLAEELAKKHGLKSAPSFVIKNDLMEDPIKFENIEEIFENLA